MLLAVLLTSGMPAAAQKVKSENVTVNATNRPLCDVLKDGLKKMHHVLHGIKVISRSPFKFNKFEDISNKYAVHYLPTKYLIDKEDRIVGKFDSEELDAKLAEIFGE